MEKWKRHQIMKDTRTSVYVKHYLTPEGITFFKLHWFPLVTSMITLQKGFVSIDYQESNEHKDCLFIALTFKNDATLDEWLEYPGHEDIVNALDEYRSRDFWEAVRFQGAETDPTTLQWTVIKTNSTHTSDLDSLENIFTDFLNFHKNNSFR